MPTTRKTPFRPRQRTEISQAYNDGIVTIYASTDSAGSGLLPVPSLTEKVRLAFQERKLGIKRYYDAKQNQIELKRVIRVQKPGELEINSQDVADVNATRLYRIDLVQAVPDVYPPSLDLSLTLYEQRAPIRPVPPFDQADGGEEVNG